MVYQYSLYPTQIQLILLWFSVQTFNIYQELINQVIITLTHICLMNYDCETETKYKAI